MNLQSNHAQVDSKSAAFLTTCSNQYSLLVHRMDELHRKSSPEAALTWIELIANFAATHHSGIFADGAIENIALDIGCDLPKPEGLSPKPLPMLGGARPGRTVTRRVVHVVTVVLTVGGHTRTILNWIRKDLESEHSLVLTRQGSRPIPPEILKVVSLSGGRIISLSETLPILQRAIWLRQLAPQLGDVAILHLIPDDIVPVVAFADKTDIPVGLVNLGDHCFWLGSTVADAIINLRGISILANKDLRFTRNDLLLPIPLYENVERLSRSQARSQLGISDSQRVILTVGRAIKYAASRRQNFFATANTLLQENQEAHLYIVGLSEQDHMQSNVLHGHDRVHFVGQISDPSTYQASADVYIEGFPFGSQTALLESVLPGVPCVRAVFPLSPLLAASDLALDGVAQVPADEQEYIEQTSEYITDAKKRGQVGQELRRRVLYWHVQDTWNEALDKAYGALAACRHSATPIPADKPSTRTVDYAISEYHGTRFPGGNNETAIEDLVRQNIMEASYALRQRGCYLDAFRFIQAANYRRFWDIKSASMAAKLIPHRTVTMLDQLQIWWSGGRQ